MGSLDKKEYDRLPVIEEQEVNLALWTEPALFMSTLEAEILPEAIKSDATPDEDHERGHD